MLEPTTVHRVSMATPAQTLTHPCPSLHVCQELTPLAYSNTAPHAPGHTTALRQSMHDKIWSTIIIALHAIDLRCG